MNLANIKGKLSRVEMKNIMAGSGGCVSDADCGSKAMTCGGTTTYVNGRCVSGTCRYGIAC